MDSGGVLLLSIILVFLALLVGIAGAAFRLWLHWSWLTTAIGLVGVLAFGIVVVMVFFFGLLSKSGIGS